MPDSNDSRDPWQQLSEYRIVRKCCRHGRGCVIASQMTAKEAKNLQERLEDAGAITEIVASGASPSWQ